MATEYLSVSLGYPCDIKIIFLIRNKKDNMESYHRSFTFNGDIRKMSYEEYRKKHHFWSEYCSSFDMHIARYKKIFTNVKVFNIIDNNTEKEINEILKYIEVKPYQFNYEVYRDNGDDLKRKMRSLCYHQDIAH